MRDAVGGGNPMTGAVWVADLNLVKQPARCCLLVAVIIPALLAITCDARSDEGVAQVHVRRTNGPLRIHPSNPRYLCDRDGRAAFLAGHEVFGDLQDRAWGSSGVLDWDRYLDFAQARGLNYLRNWIIWSTGFGADAVPERRATPMPYARTGPGLAADGGPRFDLDKWDDEFWSRLHYRARAAGERGVYVSVMLFELFGFLWNAGPAGRTLWDANVLHEGNNVNGAFVRDTDGNGIAFFTLEDPAVVERQKAFIRKAVETLNDLDNVVWELGNELPTGPENVLWMREMSRCLRECESGKPSRHPLLVSAGQIVPGLWDPKKRSFGHRILSSEEILSINPDCYAVGGTSEYDWTGGDPPLAQTVCPAIPAMADRDHLGWTGPSDNSAVNNGSMAWTILTRGYAGFCYFDSPGPTVNEPPALENARYNVGAVCRLAERVSDLAKLVPRNDMAGTGFCLADPGNEYIVWSPKAAPFTVHGMVPGATYGLEWFLTQTHEWHGADSLKMRESSHEFQPPESQVVLYLRRER